MAVLTSEPERPKLISLTVGVDLITPLSVHWEIGNAFSAMLKRKRVGMEQIHQALAIYKTIPIRYVDIDMEAALVIADELSIYAYDAYLLQCAIQYKKPLLALDKDLLGYAQQKGIRKIEASV
jgi:predicted nucleic acid-binding protein